MEFSRVSQDDIATVQSMSNHGDYEPGFDGSSGGDDMFGSDNSISDDMFDSFGSDSSDPFSSSGGFGSGSSDPFSSSGGFGGGSDPFSSSGGFGNTGGFGSNSGFGGGSTFGNNGFGGGGFGNDPFSSVGNGMGSPFGNGAGGASYGQQMQQQQKPDTMDKLMDASVDAAKSIGEILMELAKSVKYRNSNDLGYLSTNMIKTGGVIAIASGIVGLVGVTSGINMLSFSGIPLQSLVAGGLTFAAGLTGMGVSSFVLAGARDNEMQNINQIPDLPMGDDNVTDDYEDNLGDELEELLSSDIDDMLSELDDFDDDDENIGEAEGGDDDIIETNLDGMENLNDDFDFDEALKNVQENSAMTRSVLFNTFKEMLPIINVDYAKKTPIQPGDSDFDTLNTICKKALANVINCPIEDIQSNLVEAEENIFSIEFKLERDLRIKQGKLSEFAAEIETYMRNGDENDESKNATVSIVGDYFKVVMTKGVTPMVSLGDVFRDRKNCDFFLNTKNKLPIVTGIDELGNVILDDAKIFDAMLVAGKPRSGKSWYIGQLLMNLVMFNTPWDVQLVIIDPKESNFFKTIALLPHVCGLHTASDILEVFEDIINVEAPRRKKLLADNRCDDIWALRDMDIQMPVLYIFIDEYITVVNSLDKDDSKKFNEYVLTVLSQFPSLGIRLVIVPHRATGIVDKGNRTMMQFYACIRGDKGDIEDTLDTKNWKRALKKPGDIAYRTTSSEPKYIRGAVLTDSDGKNTKLIENVAKAFYKMGVDIPDMSNMRIACNRDEEEVKRQLTGDGGRLIQYDADNIINELDSEDTRFNRSNNTHSNDEDYSDDLDSLLNDLDLDNL